MAWNDKVLDNLEQLYWSPKKLGLQSVKFAPTEDRSGFVVPRDSVVDGARLYTRSSSFLEWRAAIHRDEELLNQMIEIALGIAPTAFIARAFFAPLGIETAGPIEVIGREVGARHAALAPQQYTQHDGFYVAPDAIVGMEMKLGARTSIEQFLKYCTQIALEEITHGRKKHVGLIYLVPEKLVASTRRDLALDDPSVREQVWEDPLAHTDKSRLRTLLRYHGTKIRDVGERLRLDIITWDTFLETLLETREVARLSEDETLGNLMDGLIAQVRATPGCSLLQA
ncbi:hypothetical protein [Shimia thalassica]|uniref:hypothetical protein n=1 Tax=Shimia thalassica TaxID=1715693 RepID=UPI0026E188B3|nr:hypothetical protein [Shimia thalassica]